MTEFKKLLVYEYLSVIWVSICSFTLSFGFSSWIGFKNALNYSISVFFASLIIYALANYKLKKRWNIISMCLFLLIATHFLVLAELNFISHILLFFLFCISLVYVLPLNFIKIRTVPFIKIFIVALIWILALCIVPIMNIKSTFKDYFTVLSILFFLLANIIPFDIRDSESDSNSLKTVPQILGIRKSISFAFTLLLIASVFFYKSAIQPNFSLFYLLNASFLFCLISQTPKLINSIFFFILLDSSVFLLGLMFYFFSK